ncbi:MAG: hypothetical protein AB8B69_04480 [Chitinophagales bacterium]
MKNIFYCLMSIWFITGCVADGADNSNKDTLSTGKTTAVQVDKKTNTENPLLIAEINRNLYLKNQYGKTQSMELKENDPLNMMGLVEAFRYNYFARTAAGDDNSRFYLAVYQYQSVEIANTVMANRVKEIEGVKTPWNLNDFYMPIGEYILWLHSACNLERDDWNGIIESVTSTLSEEPKSIDCQCGLRCKYE